MSNLDRMLKVLTAENVALNNVEAKLINLQNGMVDNKPFNKKKAAKKHQKEKRLPPYKKVEDKKYDSDSDDEE